MILQTFRRLAPLAFLPSLVVLRDVSAAPPPSAVDDQGVLRDRNDEPRSGTFDMRFRFMDASTGGNEILIDLHSASTGSIPGDLLVSSSTLGHAMVAKDPQPGTVFGKALDGLESGTGTIRVLLLSR